MKNSLTFSVCMPVYKGSKVLARALQSIMEQSFGDFEIIVGDDNPPEYHEEIKRTISIVQSFNHGQIRYVKNLINLGSAKTLKKLVSYARNDIIFSFCQDDILLPGALQKTHDAFLLHRDVGAVTRPYYWFEKDPTEPMRAVLPYSSERDTVLSLSDGDRAIKKIFESLGQISGLAYRRKWLTTPFHKEIFVGHIYPFAGILRRHRCVYLKDFTVAVDIKYSQTRHNPSIYTPSPTRSWVDMIESVYPKKKFSRIRAVAIEQIVTHFEGLVQIKNYAGMKLYIREVLLLLHYKRSSLTSLRFWAFVVVCTCLPPRLLQFIADQYKKKFLAPNLKHLKASSLQL